MFIEHGALRLSPLEYEGVDGVASSCALSGFGPSPSHRSRIELTRPKAPASCGFTEMAAKTKTSLESPRFDQIYPASDVSRPVTVSLSPSPVNFRRFSEVKCLGSFVATSTYGGSLEWGLPLNHTFSWDFPL